MTTFLDTTPRSECCFFTGRRKLAYEQNWAMSIQITSLILDFYYTRGVRTFLCGCETLFELIAARCVINTRDGDGGYQDMRLALVLPDARPARGLSGPQLKERRALLRQADQVLCLFSSALPENGVMRDRFLVDHAGYCIHYISGEKSRESKVLQYAKSQRVILRSIVDVTPEQHLSVLEHLDEESLIDWIMKD